jgi:hypothetical protein
MKNQEKTKVQTPQNATTKNKQQKSQDTKRPTSQNRTDTTKPSKQQDQQENQKTGLNPDINKEHKIGDLEESDTSKNQGSDVKKIKDPDPTIPERRNDPVAGKSDDYSRTRNTPGKVEANEVGEFTEVDEMDRANEDEEETSDISDEERDEEEPGSLAETKRMQNRLMNARTKMDCNESLSSIVERDVFIKRLSLFLYRLVIYLRQVSVNKLVIGDW